MVSAAVNNVATVHITPHVIRRLAIVQKDVKVVSFHRDVIKAIISTLSAPDISQNTRYGVRSITLY